uniref:Uncharacterized protein n=1 Tax=Polytomella parva TaxID=51329 RepID=A0A7S0URM9_9CHLO|mmetsp:Transcript_14198/g.24833  ORF Transcript_14198/g.24833 Transcript_14198/m.24833 type:complete len:182 (+) Transcript_14198:137-682(+)|eukprot:CAMPEP_0175056344 /NCGR_PEP_ID=MMETSP0052_2-20121109/10615_1 /TAXON_ID=51329 ORGANISM="Polytomella parva, Strain SAG 63-3" /NCGR_SAMPLE_ID=MMETSP0052_2 /ASSEMBLY_ACC=CAM_ASM_000194 /LENGTH=181 /DNA_ID=CAMNT_0016321353 /DNA_START=16 /DNA_END=561 /DNA_ORIENTATION=-
MSQRLVPESNWTDAKANLEEATLASQALYSLISDSVFLDQELYVSATKTYNLQQENKAFRNRIRDLENEVRILISDIRRRDEALSLMTRQREADARRISDIAQELKNRDVVVEAHVKELVIKTEEVEKLQEIVRTYKNGNVNMRNYDSDQGAMDQALRQLHSTDNIDEVETSSSSIDSNRL